MEKFFEEAAMQDNPLRILDDFLKEEDSLKKAKKYEDMRFIGYVLDIGYDTVTIITSDPFKIAVGGIPRNSLLIMVPLEYQNLPWHFTLLRVLQTAPTPLTKEVQQTYFELQKKSMPEIDIFTQNELQWGALETGILGMFYPSPIERKSIEFSGDINNYVSAHNYRVFYPNDELLDLIINSLVPKVNQFRIGELRLTECRMTLPKKSQPHVEILVSTNDFMGTRTAMFGKTRLGKSNVVKIIAQSLIETTKGTNNVGQLIFDINGEYANDNPQDNSCSLASVYRDSCSVYALTPKEGTPSKPLKINFYLFPSNSQKMLIALLREVGKDTSTYISSFLSVDIPNIDDLKNIPINEQKRAKRKILMYWAILHNAGFKVDESELRQQLDFNPGFRKELRLKAYNCDNDASLQNINTLSSLSEELKKFADLDRGAEGPLKSSSDKEKDLFDADDKALLGFLYPTGRTSSGPSLIQQFRKYHDQNAGDFANEIISLLDTGKTVILDLGNAPPDVMAYFSDYLTSAIFYNQVNKFSNNNLGKLYLQLYFEEAQNLFPFKDTDSLDIYKRIAKEGAKYQIGMVYSTQSVTTISKDLLAQTENFFIAHLASQDEVNALAKVNVAYDSTKDDILKCKTVGYIRMLTRSHRFVVPVQINKFEPLEFSK